MHSVTSNAVSKALSPNYANKIFITNTKTYYQSTYTAPENGFLSCCGWGTGQGNSYIIFSIDGFYVENQGNSNEAIYASFPVRKGDVVGINMYFAEYNRGLYFIPYN